MNGRRFDWIVVFFLLLATVLIAAQVPSKGRVNTTALRVREGPTTSSAILGALPEGTVVDIIGSSGADKINHAQYQGKYMYSGYIDVTEYKPLEPGQAPKHPQSTLQGTDPKKPGTSTVGSPVQASDKYPGEN